MTAFGVPRSLFLVLPARSHFVKSVAAAFRFESLSVLHTRMHPLVSLRYCHSSERGVAFQDASNRE